MCGELLCCHIRLYIHSAPRRLCVFGSVGSSCLSVAGVLAVWYVHGMFTQLQPQDCDSQLLRSDAG